MVELDKIVVCLNETVAGLRECTESFDETHKPNIEPDQFDPRRKAMERAYRYSRGYRKSLEGYRPD